MDNTEPVLENQPELAYSKNSALKVLFWYPVLWGGLTAMMSLVIADEYSSVALAIVTGIVGMLTIATAFAVRRGKEWAIWVLLLVAVLDIVGRITNGHSGFLMPGLLVIFAAHAAIVMRRYSAGRRSLADGSISS